MVGAINEELKTVMDAKGIKQADISNGLNLPKSLVSKFFAGNTTTEFGNVLSIVRYIAPSDFERLMYNHCLAVTKTSQVKSAFEYASNYRQDKLLRALLDMHKQNKAFSDLIKVYGMAFSMFTEEVDYETTLDRCRETYGALSCCELKLKVDAIEAVAQYSLGFLDSVANLLSKATERANDVKDGFIKSSIMSRLNLLSAYTLLYNKNDPKAAEELALKVVKSQASPYNMIASAYFTIGHANIFENSAKSIEYFEKAERLFREIGETIVADGIVTNDIPFARNVNGEVFESSEAGDGEQAHQLIVKGKTDEAVELLSEIISEGKDNVFTKLYLGKAKGDVKALVEVYGTLQKGGDNFFVQYVIEELSRFGINLK